MTEPIIEGYLTLTVLARRASLSERTLRKFLPEIRHYRPSARGKVLIKWADFESWLESRRVQIEKDSDVKELLESLFDRKTA